MICPNCGTENPEGARFCGDCGQSMPEAPAAGTPAAETPPPSTPPSTPPPPIPPAPIPPAPIPPAPIPPVTPSVDPTMPIAPHVPPVPPVPPDATTTFPAPPPAGPPPAAPAEKKSRRSLLLALLALLVVGAAVGSFLVFGGDDDKGDTVSIVLEPIGQSLRDDFAGNLDLRTFDSSIANVLPDVPPLGRRIATALSANSVDGGTPGLYGGSRDTATCDVDQLVDFLTDDANADKAEAWAEALGIDVDEIEDFARSLTPVRLRFDTRVTNHGFIDGRANGFQSVLEAGTAVLVDDHGVPRVKCNCGNPLAEPAELGGLSDDDALDAEALVQNLDDAWDDFDPELITVVTAAEDALDEFVLVDIDTGELFTRPVGTDGDEDGDVDLDEVCDLLGDSITCQGDTTTTTDVDATTTTIVLGTGDVQVTLEWPSNADLDLAVTDPTGETISFGNRGPSSTGGQLDVDSNVGCPPDSSSGVENIFWPPSGAPSGEYTVSVNGFSVGSGTCGGGDYVLTIKVAGQADQVFQDSVGADETDTFTFTVS